MGHLQLFIIESNHYNNRRHSRLLKIKTNRVTIYYSYILGCAINNGSLDCKSLQYSKDIKKKVTKLKSSIKLLLSRGNRYWEDKRKYSFWRH